MRSRRGTLAIAFGGGALLLIALLAIVAPLVAPADPTMPALRARLRPPSAAHVLGQDALGRDVAARLVHGARVSLGVGLASVAVSLAIGIALGALGGWAGGWVDEAIARVIDVFLAFPGLLLAIALAGVLGPSVGNVVLALGLLGWTGYARLVRTQVASLSHREFAEAARALGAGPVHILALHVLPLAAPAVLVQATFGLSGAILAEAGLSFLGLGTPPPTPSWGGMLGEGRTFLLVAPYLTLAPGAALTLTVLALQVLGDGLRDRLDVRED
ncbi:MAG: ABC transporter permease [Candidatus Binatia bacterium]